MRKENSELITKFITDAGDFRQNRDYFAYVELDDFACWVLAEGLDTAENKLSSELAVGNIINDFTEKPSISKRAIKNYIKRANDLLVRESKIVKLHASILVVISDYKSIRWGSVGNTRLYHLRRDKIRAKSKDHSMAQMMVEAGEVEERKINQHIERKNLTRYLGRDDKVKPFVSKKRPLEDSDVVLLCTSGFWENIFDKELEGILSETSEVDEFVTNLETHMLSKGNNNLDNYTIASFFAKKVFKEDNSKKGLYKKIAMVLISLLLLGGGFMGYKKVKKINARKAAKSIKIEKFKTSLVNEKKGDKLYEDGRYEEALKEYEKTKKAYQELNKEEELDELDEKIKKTNTLLTGISLEQEGNDMIISAEYKKALTKYEKAKLYYLQIPGYSLERIEVSIGMAEKILEAVAFEHEGDIYSDSKNYTVAIDKYNLAGRIYNSYQLVQEANQIENKIKKAEKNMTVEKDMAAAEKVELTGDELFKLQEFDKSIIKYMEAKIQYNELNNAERVSKVEAKINKVQEAKNAALTERKIKKASEIEAKGDELFQFGEYENSITKYIEAKNIYSDIDKVDKLTTLDAKINKVRAAKNNAVTSQRLEVAAKIEAKGDELFQYKEFEKAVVKYMEVKTIYSELNMADKLANIEEKLNKVEVTKKNYISNLRADKAKKLETHGDELFNLKDYKSANSKYMEAKLIYEDLDRTDKVTNLANKINNVVVSKNVDKAKKYEELGDVQLTEQNFDDAIFNYKHALKIYNEQNITEEATKITKKINKTKMQKYTLAANKFIEKGDIKLEEESFDEALFNFKQALAIYNENGITEGIEKVQSKIDITNVRKKYGQAKEKEKAADVHLEKEEYAEAISTYEEAKAIYQEIGKTSDVDNIDEKIKFVEEEKKSLLGKIFNIF